MTNRIIWAALLCGQVAAAAALTWVTSQGRRQAMPTPPLPMLVGIDAAMLAVAIAAVVVTRWVGYRGAATDAAIRARYGTMMLIPMACLEGTSFAGIIFAFLYHHVLLTGIVPAVAVALQLTLFPRAKVSLS